VKKQGLISGGNAIADGAQTRGWFIGHFMPEETPLWDPTVEIKYSLSAKGRSRSREDATASSAQRSLQILVAGKVKTSLVIEDGHDQHVLLEKPGDWCLWEAHAVHYWEILEDSVIITIRWPSIDTK
jgi:hypothetical protein